MPRAECDDDLDRRRRRPPRVTLRTAARTRRARLLVLHEPRVSQGSGAGGQPERRAHVCVAAAAPAAARNGGGLAARAPTLRRLLRAALTWQPDRRLGLEAEQRHSKSRSA